MELSTETPLILLGFRIRSLRNAKGWTLEELGEQADTNHKHIGEIERGRQNPSFIVLAKIAEALGVELAELFRFETEGLGRKEIVQRISGILESMPDEDLRKMLSVLRALVPLSCGSQRQSG